MPNKPKRRKNWGNYIKGNINHVLALGTLGGRTLVGSVLSDTLGEVSRISSVKATWNMRSYTPADDDGPITVGLAHADYTDAEIEEVLEVIDSWNRSNKIDQERSKRLVRTIGTFGAGSSDPLAPIALNDGKPITTKLNWRMQSGQTLRVWAYNQGSSALATTVPDVTVLGHANIWMQ